MWENLDAVFGWVLRGSLYSPAIILIIAVTQALTRRALSARWNYALWLILLARLVLPAAPETKWSLWNLAPERLTRITETDSGRLNTADITVSTAIPAVADGYQERHANALTGETRLPQNTDGFSPRGIWQVLSFVWLAGVLAVAAITAFANLRLWNSVRGLDLVTDSKLLKLFEDCKRRMRVKAATGLVVTDRVENPFLFGFIRPRILLPADLVRRFSDDQIRCVFLHELAHQKRGDIITGWLLAFLQALHWFNPVIWWAFSRMRSDRETACDALVLARISDDARRHYADTLIGLLECCKSPQRLPVAAGIIENKAQFKRRLIMITRFKHSTRREIIAAAALFAVLSIALLTSPRALLSQSGERSAGNDGSDARTSQELMRLGSNIPEPELIHKVEPIQPEGISGMVELEVKEENERSANIDRMRKVENRSRRHFSPILFFSDPSGTVWRSANVVAVMPLFSTESGRRYYGPAVVDVEPEVRIDKQLSSKVREAADANWPVADGINIRTPIYGHVLGIVLISENGNLDGVRFTGDLKIPALEEALANIQILSPGYMDGEAVPSFVMFQIDSPQNE